MTWTAKTRTHSFAFTVIALILTASPPAYANLIINSVSVVSAAQGNLVYGFNPGQQIGFGESSDENPGDVSGSIDYLSGLDSASASAETMFGYDPVLLTLAGSGLGNVSGHLAFHPYIPGCFSSTASASSSIEVSFTLTTDYAGTLSYTGSGADDVVLTGSHDPVAGVFGAGDYTLSASRTLNAGAVYAAPQYDESYDFGFTIDLQESQTIPEPATMLMLGCLGAGMATAGRVSRRKKG